MECKGKALEEVERAASERKRKEIERENTLKLRLVSRGSLGDLKVRDEGIERMQRRKGIDGKRERERCNSTIRGGLTGKSEVRPPAKSLFPRTPCFHGVPRMRP